MENPYDKHSGYDPEVWQYDAWNAGEVQGYLKAKAEQAEIVSELVEALWRVLADFESEQWIEPSAIRMGKEAIAKAKG